MGCAQAQSMPPHRPLLRRPRRACHRGVTLIEVLIVVSILSLLSAGVAAAVVVVDQKARRDLAAKDAQSLRTLAMQWRSATASSECPTIARLRQDRILDRSSRARDPWGSAFAIRCDDDEIVVTSPGKDRKEGTDDDITEPPPEQK
jgi:general secretion pathway protein G